MGFLHFLAHEGHDHAIAATTVPWWQDQTNVTVVVAAALVGMLLVLRARQANFGLTLILTMAFLLVVGVTCYSVAPILSIVSLSAGMVLALGSTLLQLGYKKNSKK